MYMKLRQESYTDMELAELQVNIIKYLMLNFQSVNIDKVFIIFYQTYITEFCQEFVDVFSEYSSSSCKIPKLHVLRYHVVSSIRLYGSMNGMSTETYETLHKSNVKNPYRMTNKKNYVPQMLNTVCY
jgi:hypothetical protein